MVRGLAAHGAVSRSHAGRPLVFDPGAVAHEAIGIQEIEGLFELESEATSVDCRQWATLLERGCGRVERWLPGEGEDSKLAIFRCMLELDVPQTVAVDQLYELSARRLWDERLRHVRRVKNVLANTTTGCLECDVIHSSMHPIGFVPCDLVQWRAVSHHDNGDTIAILSRDADIEADDNLDHYAGDPRGDSDDPITFPCSWLPMMGCIRQKDVAVGHVVRKRGDSYNSRVFTYVQVRLQGPLRYLAKHLASDLASSYIDGYTKACVIATAHALLVRNQAAIPSECEVFSIGSDSETDTKALHIDNMASSKSNHCTCDPQDESDVEDADKSEISSYCLVPPFAKLLGSELDKGKRSDVSQKQSSRRGSAVAVDKCNSYNAGQDEASIIADASNQTKFYRKRSRARSAERRQNQMLLTQKRLSAVMEARGQTIEDEAHPCSAFETLDDNEATIDDPFLVDESDADISEPGPEPAPRLIVQKHADEPRRSILPSDALLFCFPAEQSLVLQ